MIDRSIRWKLLVFFLPFSLAFGGVGVGAMWMLYRTLSPALSQGRGRTAGSGLGGLWVFTFFWNVISFPIAFLFVPQIIEDGEWMGLLVLLFPLIGVLMLWGALAGTYRYLRYGYVQPPVTLSLSLSQGRGRTSSKMVETMEQFSGMRGVETAAGIARHINVRHLVIGMVVLYVVWQVGTIVFAIVRSFE